MKNTMMTGLKNILKGSMANQILGDFGGFSYQGQNIYAKAVKCKKGCLTLIVDSLEQNFTITAYLPLSLNGTLSQNYIGIFLPNASSGSNPCVGYPAC